ncbi:TPA: hypothetical protein U1D13_001688 [Streptococcus suis]|uniref:hypothetical protein n=1 Tax=Streptococcus TaxID=1301 RepID=UPI001ABEE1E2|nr:MULTISPECIES: hypothetical protein [Streptococcus]MBO4110411.1 hypothetical protein [Streptococcus suis]MCF1634098.1 hypothetical protein [Streptococcus gallolyticus]WFM79351.1 hypothetical protein P7F70_07390 [Streptococcus pluranimalium]HEM3715623.1 hypothetical protein [Streptococcus suis]
MIDLKKLKALKLIGYVFLVIVAVVVGVGIGQSLSGSQTKASKTEETKQETTEATLSQNQVEDFLISYFTKKDLGENRNRYKEYMTDGLYQQEVAKEEEPTSQTYKGFVVDFEYKSSEIFINQEKLSVIVQVNYVNTLLDEKKNYDTAQKDVMNKLTLRLTYVNENGTLKVNKMESIILTDQTGDYGILDNTTTSSDETESSSEDTSASENSTEASSEEDAS